MREDVTSQSTNWSRFLTQGPGFDFDLHGPAVVNGLDARRRSSRRLIALGLTRSLGPFISRERGREWGAYAGKIMLAPTAVGGYGGVNPRKRGRESGAYAGKIMLAPTAVGGYGG